MRYLGVDLHTTNFVVCFLPEHGKSRVVRFALTTEGLTAFRRQLRADDAIAVEAGQTAYYFYDQIQTRVKEVVLVNPHPRANSAEGRRPSTGPEKRSAPRATPAIGPGGSLKQRVNRAFE